MENKRLHHTAFLKRERNLPRKPKMIVNKRLANSLFQTKLKIIFKIPKAKIYNRARIGNRDWVGFGRNGSANYLDDVTFPCPAIRFRENTNELLALREKEKGDWRKLTTEEKKTLYRASFRQTLEEVLAPTGLWKSILGATLFAIGVAFWLSWGVKYIVVKEEIHTLKEEYRRQILRKMLDCKMGHISGISSKWDYEKDDWKK